MFIVKVKIFAFRAFYGTMVIIHFLLADTRYDTYKVVIHDTSLGFSCNIYASELPGKQ